MAFYSSAIKRVLFSLLIQSCSSSEFDICLFSVCMRHKEPLWGTQLTLLVVYCSITPSAHTQLWLLAFDQSKSSLCSLSSLHAHTFAKALASTVWLVKLKPDHCKSPGKHTFTQTHTHTCTEVEDFKRKSLDEINIKMKTRSNDTVELCILTTHGIRVWADVSVCCVHVHVYIWMCV